MSCTTPMLSLEATLDPAEAARFFRHPALSTRRAGRTRSVAVTLGWLDTAKGALAAEGLTLEAGPGPRALRRLVLTSPAPDAPWRPGTPAAVLDSLAPDAVPAEAGEAALLSIAAFAGRRVSVPLTGAVEASLLHGSLRAPTEQDALSQLVPGGGRQLAQAGGRQLAQAGGRQLAQAGGRQLAQAGGRQLAPGGGGQQMAERPIARLTLTGPPEAVLETMRELAGALPLLPPRASLAEEARAFARQDRLRPRRLGAPLLAADLAVEAALCGVVGHLLEVVLWHAPVAVAGEDPSGVHQMRVALRRLRSALRAFRPAADAPALREFDQGLKGLASTLGPARDWDVFLAGLGAELAEALPGEPRIAALLQAGQRHRAAAYETLRGLLASPAFRQLVWDGVALETTQPWRAEDNAKAAARREAPLDDLASHMLSKAWHRMTEVGEDIAHLPDAEFHALRLHGKRLRYLSELFAPLFGRKRGRRFLERLAEMQEQFGLANDASVARGLVESEAQGKGAWAAGVAEGWVLARSRRARDRAAKAWTALLATEAFWNQG